MLIINKHSMTRGFSKINNTNVAEFFGDFSLSDETEYGMNILDLDLYLLNIPIVAKDFQDFCYNSVKEKNGITE